MPLVRKQIWIYQKNIEYLRVLEEMVKDFDDFAVVLNILRERFAIHYDPTWLEILVSTIALRYSVSQII
jgi:hypothetical protein